MKNKKTFETIELAIKSLKTKEMRWFLSSFCRLLHIYRCLLKKDLEMKDFVERIKNILFDYGYLHQINFKELRQSIATEMENSVSSYLYNVVLDFATSVHDCNSSSMVYSFGEAIMNDWILKKYK